MLVELRSWIKLSALSMAVTMLCSNALAIDGAESAPNSQAAPISQPAPASQATVASQLPLAGQELDVGLTVIPPFAFITDSISKVNGIDVDIVLELQKRTGFKLKNDRFNVMSFSELMDLGAEGKVDILGGGITLSDGRRPIFDFSEPYMLSPLVLVVRTDSDIKSVNDLRNRKLSVEAGTTAVDYFPNAEELNISLDENPSAFMCIYSVHAGLADALVMDEPMIAFYIDNWTDSKLKIVEQISEPGDLGLLFKKNAKFTPHLQLAFKEMAADGTLEKILDKYRKQKQ